MAPLPIVAGPPQEEAPASGLELANTRPERSPATHRPEALQETELKACSGSIRCRLQLVDGEPGFALANAFPEEVHGDTQPF